MYCLNTNFVIFRRLYTRCDHECNQIYKVFVLKSIKLFLIVFETNKSKNVLDISKQKSYVKISFFSSHMHIKDIFDLNMFEEVV